MIHFKHSLNRCFSAAGKHSTATFFSVFAVIALAIVGWVEQVPAETVPNGTDKEESGQSLPAPDVLTPFNPAILKGLPEVEVKVISSLPRHIASKAEIQTALELALRRHGIKVVETSLHKLVYGDVFFEDFGETNHALMGRLDLMEPIFVMRDGSPEMGVGASWREMDLFQLKKADPRTSVFNDLERLAESFCNQFLKANEGEGSELQVSNSKHLSGQK